MSQRLLKFYKGLSFFVLAVIVLSLGFFIGVRYVKSQNERFSRYDQQIDNLNKKNNSSDELKDKVILDRTNKDAIMVYIEIGDDTGKIAKKLEEKGIIDHPVLFKILSKLNGFDGGYQAGTHFISPDMPYDEMMFALTQKPITSKILFREGLSYLDFKKVLKDNGVVFNETKLDDIAKYPLKYQLDYPFLKDLSANLSRNYPLEGYLFPDTYTFDLNVSEKILVDTMLHNFSRHILPEQYERAKALGMSFDQVVTLASVIEKEAGNVQEMYKISRVFHNRLAKQMPLQSCATVNFIRQENNLPPVFIVSEADLKRDNPYNTYLNAGLPPGPICNPGLEAIRAALYPDTEQTDLLYFSATGEGTNVFATDFSGHLKNVQKYLVPFANEQGFTGQINQDKNTVYSQGGDITNKKKNP